MEIVAAALIGLAFALSAYALGMIITGRTARRD